MATGTGVILRGLRRPAVFDKLKARPFDAINIPLSVWDKVSSQSLSPNYMWVKGHAIKERMEQLT